MHYPKKETEAATKKTGLKTAAAMDDDEEHVQLEKGKENKENTRKKRQRYR